jgi:hypothetical protein
MKMKTQVIIRLGFLSFMGIVAYFWTVGLLAKIGIALFPGYEITTNSLNRVFFSGLYSLSWIAFGTLAMLEQRHQRLARINKPPRTLREVVEELRIVGEQEAFEVRRAE